MHMNMHMLHIITAEDQRTTEGITFSSLPTCAPSKLTNSTYTVSWASSAYREKERIDHQYINGEPFNVAKAVAIHTKKSQGIKMASLYLFLSFLCFDMKNTYLM